jgi:hypothetical protein
VLPAPLSFVGALDSHSVLHIRPAQVVLSGS